MTRFVLILGAATALAFNQIPATARAQTGPATRLKVTGHWDGNQVVAQKIRQRDPRKDARRASVAGEIAREDTARRRFAIGPLEIGWDEGTQLIGLAARDLRRGSVIEVVAEVGSADALRALTIERATVDPGEIELLAAAEGTSLRRDGSTELRMLGVRVVAPSTLPVPQLALTRRPDERRPSDQLTLPLAGGFATLGGEVETALGAEHDLAFGDGRDDAVTLETELQLEIAWQVRPSALVFVEAKLADERDLHAQGRGRERDTFVERGETWFYWRAPGESGLAIQVGRQAFSESREWWWDEDLDGLRVHWTRFPFAVEIGVAKELAQVDSRPGHIEPEQRGVVRALARASWGWAPGHVLEAFALRHDDGSDTPAIGEVIRSAREDESDAELSWAGLRAMGGLELPRRHELGYWVDVAYVTGRERLVETAETPSGDERVIARRRRDVRGFAVDLGTTFSAKWPSEPSFTAGFALGSGKRSGDGFRQTGLHDDNGRFAGVEGFRYYGQALDPELSNLMVATAGVGFPVFADSSLDLVYHRYWQQRRSDFLRDANLDFDPTGRSRSLGDGFDLVLGFQEWEHLELEVVVGAFRAGRAFAGQRGKVALDAFVRVGWNF